MFYNELLYRDSCDTVIDIFEDDGFERKKEISYKRT